MPSRVILTTDPGDMPADWRQADLVLTLDGARRNVSRNLRGLYQHLPRRPSPLALDLVDIATAVYAADIGLPRGRNEEWVRHQELMIPVRDPDFWRAQATELGYLLYVLTRDGYQMGFMPAAPGDAPEPGGSPFAADCACLFSGGIDSLAGATMLVRTGRRPLLVCHQSGNPTIQAAQGQVAAILDALQPHASAFAGVRLQTETEGGFPGPEGREASQRSRGFLFMALALAAAEALGVEQAFMPENGILTIAVPLSPARIGGLSTRSTHPKVLALMNRLADQAGFGCNLVNPFVCQTKGEIIRDVLRPVLSPFEIQRTVSCWATGRASRQCGGCVACLVRRLAMLSAGLPDEAYELEVLARPREYVGTDAYANLVDLLGLCIDYRSRSEMELLRRSPELLDCVGAGVNLADAMAMYHRFADEVAGVLQAHFPDGAGLVY